LYEKQASEGKIFVETEPDLAVSGGLTSCKDLAWRMMMDGAGEHYPSEVAVARHADEFSSLCRAKKRPNTYFPRKSRYC